MDNDLELILKYLNEKRGFDFSGYHQTMLKRRIDKRLAATTCNDYSAYYFCLQRNTDELDHLLDVLTINVSRLFPYDSF